MSISLIEAIELAEYAHQGQVDKSGNPYIHHPIRVMDKMITDEEKIVAILHDVVEDTDVTLADISYRFGKDITDAVDAITHRKHEPREEYYTRVKANELALQVKLADIADNMAPERMWQLDGETRDRLYTKYNKALVILLD